MKKLYIIFASLACLLLLTGCGELAVLSSDTSWDRTEYSCSAKEDCVQIIKEHVDTVNEDWVRCSFSKCEFYKNDVTVTPAEVSGEEIQ